MIFVDDVDGRVRIAISAPDSSDASRRSRADVMAIAYVGATEAVDVADELRRVAEQILRARAVGRERVGG